MSRHRGEYAVEAEPGSCAVGVKAVTGSREVLFKAWVYWTRYPTTYFLLERREACGVYWSWMRTPVGREGPACGACTLTVRAAEDGPRQSARWRLIP